MEFKLGRYIKKETEQYRNDIETRGKYQTQGVGLSIIGVSMGVFALMAFSQYDNRLAEGISAAEAAVSLAGGVITTKVCFKTFNEIYVKSQEPEVTADSQPASEPAPESKTE